MTRTELLVSKDNPYQPLIQASNNDPTELQSQYETHRTTRKAQQKAKILDQTFSGWNTDPILKKLDGPEKEEGFIDPRNCLTIWARPPLHVRQLIATVQQALQSVAPSLWLMPSENLHMTALEVAHSLTEEQIEKIVQTLELDPIKATEIADYTYSHRSRLVRPMVSFDTSAMALSFVPAGSPENGAADGDEVYTYHHLRRDILEKVRAAGIHVASRYIVPSSHLTIARFVNQVGFQTEGADVVHHVDHTQVKALID